ncbi:MAG: protein-L-isoaspartate(D-aspartate) O-methyltransferase [Burkholderiales bacterium]|nr:protein-L-isoaspartate(D-aspartate) O-methyltransferase [Burkholderiales bacterium]
MVREHVAGRGVRDPGVLAAMGRVPREAFVPAGLRDSAYDDGPLPIEDGQTISQPYIVALMLEAAAIRPGDRVLEVGAGSGYASAVASLLAAQVEAVERHPGLAASARERLARLGYGNVAVHCADGSGGWAEAAPYDAILVAASGPRVPAALRAQLAVGGRLVMPVGESSWQQRLVRVTRRDENAFEEADLGGVVFVPLVGEHGWAPGAGC